MKEYWNGEGGEKWLRFQEIIDVSLVPFGQKVMEAAAISSEPAAVCWALISPGRFWRTPRRE